MNKLFKKCTSLFFTAAMTVTITGSISANDTDIAALNSVPPEAAGTNQMVPNIDPTIGFGKLFPLSEYPDGSYFSKKSSGCTCHGVSCSYSGGCDCLVFDYAIQCDGFARYIYCLSHNGDYISKKKNTKDQINVENSFGTVSKAKNYFLNTPKGTYIRVNTKIQGGKPTGYDHSIAIVDTTDSYITLYHANYGGKCKVEYKQYTWQEFISKFPYLKYYIK